MVGFRVGHLPLPRAAPAAKKRGSLSPPSSFPCGAPGEAGTREAQPRYGCRGRRGESVLSRVWCAVSGES